MTRHNYRYRGRWNRRARNYVKLRGKKLAPVWVTNSRSCRESKRRYSWITVNGQMWRYLNPRLMQNVVAITQNIEWARGATGAQHNAEWVRNETSYTGP